MEACNATNGRDLIKRNGYIFFLTPTTPTTDNTASTMQQMLRHAVALCLVSATQAAKPNFIIFHSDDMGYGDLGCYGHPMSDTPHIDKLATEGMKFASIYTSSPVCSPSRAGLLTGRYQMRSGVYPGVFWANSKDGLPLNETTFASVLQANGYATGMVGKWHLGVGKDWEYLPTKHGFDSWTGIPYSHDMPDPADCFYDADGTPGLGCFPATNPEPMHTTCNVGELNNEPDMPTTTETVQIPLFSGDANAMKIIQQPANLTTLDDTYTDAATGFIKQASASGKPFLLYYAFQHTHHPNYAGVKFFNTTDRGMFGDSIKALDWSLGEVLAALTATGQDDNTVVFFAADNGPSLMRMQRGGSAGLLRCGKGTTWEGGQRVPGIIKWPGHIKAGTMTREIASTMDMFPTIISIAGLEMPTDRVYDSYDMSSFLFADNAKAAEGDAVRDYFVYVGENIVDATGLHAIRYKEWKAHWRLKGSHAPADYFVESCRPSYDETLVEPILFNLNHDAGEHVPLNASLPMYSNVMNIINQIRTDFLASKGLFGPSATTTRDQLAQPCSQPNCTDPATIGDCCRI